MYKTETHLHVSEVSRCAKLSASEIITLYRQAGYHTVFVTDHFKQDYFTHIAHLTWEEKVDWYFGGYRSAKEAGDACGVQVLPAIEMHLNGSPNHYLLYGVDPAFLVDAPQIFDLTPEALYAYAKQWGVTVVQAHPYRDGVCFPTPTCVDAMEVINPNPRHENFDGQAIAIARQYDLPMTSGSDAHRPEDVGRGGVMTTAPITCTYDYIHALLGNGLQLIGEER